MSDPDNEPSGGSGQRQWFHWLLTLTAVTLAGVFVIPFLRAWPESIHAHLGGLAAWQRTAFILGLCIVIVSILFKLFSPRLSHLRYLRTHPPIWLAWFIGICLVGVIDLTVGLSSKQSAASPWEWLGYGGGSTALAILYVWLTTPGVEMSGKKGGSASVDVTATPADWPSLESWLHADAPAKYDFLGNYAIARRLKTMLVNGTRSIGIVGPFGAGKTTIVEWIMEMVENEHQRTPPLLLFSQNSCWGFESSASAIHTMLADGIKRVAKYIDAFQVGSLPESYRQMFSAGGEWLDKASRLIFRHRDPIEQFRSLSNLLRAMDSRLVFIVEDLDRNASHSFDIQDVLAFLQQLKDFPNLSFMLTGGLNAPKRIDFAKLCDHIEYLKTVSVQDSATLVCCLRERCLDASAFPREVMTPPDDNQWTYASWMFLLRLDEMQPPEAIARLLSTPRSLRHALGRTYRAWQNLVGEIDWDHLLAVNVLRYAAPEALSFLLRHWNRLNDEPSNEDYRRRQVEGARSALKQEWEEIIREVEWDAKAARALIDFILPATQAWLDDNRQGSASRLQGVHKERYWQRALNEVLGAGEIPDQSVARDIAQWRKSPSAESSLVNGLCSSAEYCTVWENLARRYWGVPIPELLRPTQEVTSRPDNILLLSEQVISRICKEHGSAAAGDSQGFHSVCSASKQCVPRTEGNRVWLEGRIREAMATSLALVNILFRWWATSPDSIVRPEDENDVRMFVVKLAREMLSDAQHLRKIVNRQHGGSLQTLVFLPCGDGHTTACTDIESWKWLGPVLVDALKQGDTTIATEIYWLVASLRADARSSRQYQVDPAVFEGFFGEGTTEVIQLLSDMSGRLEGDDRNFVSAMVESAKAALSPPLVDSPGQSPKGAE